MRDRPEQRDDKIDRHYAARNASIVTGLFWGLLVYAAKL